MTKLGFEQGFCEVCGGTEFYKSKACRQCRRIYSKQYDEDNKEVRQQYRKVYGKQYYEDHKEIIAERGIQYRKDNKERRAENAKKWAENNRDKRNASKHNRRARKAKNGGSHTGEQWVALYNFFNGLCLHPECLADNLSYPLHGEGCIHKDHIISVFNGGTSYIDNYQPLCEPHNLSKNKKCTDYRENAIEYLGLDFDEYYDLIGVE